MEMLRGVQDLKAGQPSTVHDFFGFAEWKEVVQFSESPEGGHLQTFVNLVQSRGEKQLMWALGRTVEEGESDIVISTAHKAKGREWNAVRLTDDFLKSKPTKGTDEASRNKEANDRASELRLFYVALTRAKEVVEVTEPLISLFGIRQSTERSPIRQSRARVPQSQRDLKLTRRLQRRFGGRPKIGSRLLRPFRPLRRSRSYNHRQNVGGY